MNTIYYYEITKLPLLPLLFTAIIYHLLPLGESSSYKEYNGADYYYFYWLLFPLPIA